MAKSEGNVTKHRVVKLKDSDISLNAEMCLCDSGHNFNEYLKVITFMMYCICWVLTRFYLLDNSF